MPGQIDALYTYLSESLHCTILCSCEASSALQCIARCSPITRLRVSTSPSNGMATVRLSGRLLSALYVASLFSVVMTTLQCAGSFGRSQLSDFTCRCRASHSAILHNKFAQPARSAFFSQTRHEKEAFRLAHSGLRFQQTKMQRCR